MLKNKSKHSNPKNNDMSEQVNEPTVNEEVKSENNTSGTNSENVSDAQATNEQVDSTSNKNQEEELKNQVAELQDKYMRMVAEFDNYRKRTLKERADLLKSAGEDIMVNLLPVLDDFERGLQAIEGSTDIDALKLGVSLIYNKFREFIAQRGVKEIEAQSQDFNVDLHEAITKIPAPDENLKGKVVDVVQKGYVLNEKVIRFAKVVVGE